VDDILDDIVDDILDDMGMLSGRISLETPFLWLYLQYIVSITDNNVAESFKVQHTFDIISLDARGAELSPIQFGVENTPSFPLRYSRTISNNIVRKLLGGKKTPQLILVIIIMPPPY
jgi:hypothetical protein